jgi:hypothetical protein
MRALPCLCLERAGGVVGVAEDAGAEGLLVEAAVGLQVPVATESLAKFHRGGAAEALGREDVVGDSGAAGQ